MTDYRTIEGAAIQSRTSTTGVAGEIWYDSSNGVFKLNALTSTGTWATGNSLNTARTSMYTGPIGVQTAALASGGSTPSGRSNANEEYNGTSWTTVNNVNVSLSSMGS